MIKLHAREMKNLSRILTMMLCFAPLCVNAAGTVATTAGNNLTAFNPSTANNNQWANMSNGRYDTNTSAKVDFGNCNSLILRCAQPKCANGGCNDMSVASAIVAGCVQSNNSCKQYGNDLVQYMSAQLVANSNAKINEQNAAAQQAAAVAAQQAAQQSAAQMQEMQYQMQQMQQQMAQQQAESQQQLQAALAQQAAQSAAAVESMKSAATAAAMENEAGVSGYQQDAINRGISADVLERKKITGQIMTELENAEVSLKEVKVAINAAFEYAKCDARGNNCEGPKRIKKWRELATEFLTPYDNTIDKVYDALELAQLVGVNLSDIYMMLNNSCNRWGQYMCQGTGNENSKVYYGYTGQPEDKKEAPRVCNSSPENEAAWKQCRPCTLLKVLSNGEDVYEGWVYAEENAKSNQTIVACASGALDSSALFARRTKNKNGAGLVDIDKMDTWLHQTEPRKTKNKNPDELVAYCRADDAIELLEKSTLSKVVPTSGAALCVKKPGDKTGEDREECGYISSVYAICDAHQYNAGLEKLDAKIETDAQKTERCNKLCTSDNEIAECKDENGKKKSASDIDALKEACKRGENKRNQVDSTETETIKEIIALKTTAISQQMYKQYEYLNATLRRLKTQLEKATLTATLEAAGAKSEDGSSSGLLGSNSSKNSQYRDCSGKSKQGLLECMRENYSLLSAQIKTNKKCDRYAKEQLTNAVTKLKSLTKLDLVCKTDSVKACEDCLDSYDTGLSELDSIILKEESDRRGYGRY